MNTDVKHAYLYTYLMETKVKDAEKMQTVMVRWSLRRGGDYVLRGV